ncbi:PREDICTED: uncharacterized protein LOC109207640 [Nicotiana attenuata]|uniref:uncharacterized protein LOC109207640 n=1 Tax=Nicotiana attenuata TaxID=49451 RepID=UPI000905B0EA|nr:PREDICTED: uncharacterized protein LOC109207640 [Nicotiana attenuata]
MDGLRTSVNDLTARVDTLASQNARSYSELGGRYTVFWGQNEDTRPIEKSPDENEQEKAKKNWTTVHRDRGRTAAGTRWKKAENRMGESVNVTTDQVQHPLSTLDILVSTIDVAPLNTLPPTSEKTQVEKFTIEKCAGDLGKKVDTMAVEPVVEGEGSKELVQKGASDGLSFSWTKDAEDDGGEKEEKATNSHEEHDAQNIAKEEEKSENEGASEDEKESDTEDKTGEEANDSAKEENLGEEEEVSESEGEDQEKVSESEGGVEKSEEEERNVSKEYGGSMTIGNTVIALSEEIF